MSTQFWLATHLCVNFIPNLEGSMIMWPSLYASNFFKSWASLAISTAFIFESVLIGIPMTSRLCHLPFLTLLKLSHHILLRLFVHQPTTPILRLMSFVQLFVLPILKLLIQVVQSFQYHTLLWRTLFNFFLTLIIIILAMNFVFLLLLLLWNVLQQFLWPTQLLLWAMSVINNLTATYGTVDILRKGVSCCAGHNI